MLHVSMQFILIIGRFIVLSTLIDSMVSGSMYDPHVFPRQGPFFEGWYMRISDMNIGDHFGISDSAGTSLGTSGSAGTSIGTSGSAGTSLETSGSAGTGIGTSGSAGTSLGTCGSAGTSIGTSGSAGTSLGTCGSAGTGIGTSDSADTGIGINDSAETGIGTSDSAGIGLGTSDNTGTGIGTTDSAGTGLGTSYSIGLVFGIMVPPSSSNVSAPLIIASILFRNCEDIGTHCRLVSVDGKFSPEDQTLAVKGKPVSVDPDKTSPANFTWHVSDGTNCAYFEQNGGKTVFRFEISDLIVSGEANNPVPWNAAGSGPEGWLVYLPLPFHWFVYSIRSDLSFYMIENITSGAVTKRNHGAVHLEKNWGNSFPKEWIWSEGVSSSSRNASFAIAGGLVDLPMFSVNAFLIGYRNQATGLSLDFRPDNSLITKYINGCKGLVTLSVNSFFYSLNISIFAPMESFSTCLIGPKSCGFVHACVESYDATVIFKIYQRSFFSFGGTLIDSQTFQYSALEFGGTYVCDNNCPDPC